MSLIKKLREEKRTNEEFEVMLKHLTLEEIFYLRLELEDEIFRNNLTGYRLLKIIKEVITEGLVRFAIDLKPSKIRAAKFLSVDIITLEKNMLKFGILAKKKNVSKIDKEK